MWSSVSFNLSQVYYNAVDILGSGYVALKLTFKVLSFDLSWDIVKV